jgi:hypothetical protein
MSSIAVPQSQTTTATEQSVEADRRPGSASRPPSYHSSRPPHYTAPVQSRLEMLEEFKAYKLMQDDNWGAQKGVVTGPAKDPFALFKWVGRKMSHDNKETSQERKARKYREWEEAMKESGGISRGDMETTKIM